MTRKSQLKKRAGKSSGNNGKQQVTPKTIKQGRYAKSRKKEQDEKAASGSRGSLFIPGGRNRNEDFSWARPVTSKKNSEYGSKRASNYHGSNSDSYDPTFDPSSPRYDITKTHFISGAGVGEELIVEDINGNKLNKPRSH